MNIYEQIAGRQIYVQVAKGLSVRISARELQVSITNWDRNQMQHQIEILAQTDKTVTLKFKGQQDLLSEKVHTNQTQKTL